MEQYILKSSDIIREMKQTIKAKRESSTKHCEPEVAQVLRKKANSLYSSRKLTEALSLYTQSLRVSSENSEDANLAFGNRSAVNFHLKEFKLSLKDIDNVLESNTAPPALLKKLLLRKARCLDSIECDGQEVLQTCEEIERLSREQTIPTLSTSERELLDNLKSSGTATSQEDDITVYQTAHPSLPSASSVLEMKHSRTKGRYLQVKVDTPSGSVLICEQPYVMVLLPQYWDTHCYHCLQLVHTVPVFCRSSSCKVKYCSVKCKTQSYNYHQFECKDLNTIVDTGIGHLACSVITHTGYKTLLSKYACSYRTTL
ncbi:PIGB [Bugula neritina]|uniref:PIGB n=1 Tax=Bugula neritina TaxID=10212 RepID=A0A7J7KIE4_BUGNE|nr:PIGB [Bugula neritina]